jgi:hypothetical protein
VDILKHGAEALLLALWCDFQCTILQHSAVAPVAFDDSVTGRARGGRVHAEHAETAIPGGGTSGWDGSFHRLKSTAFALSLPELCLYFPGQKKNGHPDYPGLTVEEEDRQECPSHAGWD